MRAQVRCERLNVENTDMVPVLMGEGTFLGKGMCGVEDRVRAKGVVLPRRWGGRKRPGTFRPRKEHLLVQGERWRENELLWKLEAPQGFRDQHPEASVSPMGQLGEQGPTACV